MTNSEMRRRLAEAMGWTDVREDERTYRDVDGALISERGMRGQINGKPGPGSRCWVPDPLESDRDAALLRAWCVEQTWCASLIIASDCLGVEVTIYDADGEPIDDTPTTVTRVGEPDPCRRERLALCQAVLQALEVESYE